jgi:hypothetical protein
MGLNAMPSSQTETSTPPGNAHMPGAMDIQPVVDPGEFEPTPAFASLEPEQHLEPIHVSVTPLPEHLRLVGADHDTRAAEPGRGTDPSGEREPAPAARISGV